jgi:hypothetical protein
MGQELNRPLTETEEEKYKVDTPKEKIVLDRIWNKRPDGFTIKIPTTQTVEELVIQTDKKCNGSPIRVHKVSTRTKAWTTRMNRDPKKLHSRGKISEREGLTRQPRLLQGPTNRHRIH